MNHEPEPALEVGVYGPGKPDDIASSAKTLMNSVQEWFKDIGTLNRSKIKNKIKCFMSYIRGHYESKKKYIDIIVKIIGCINVGINILRCCGCIYERGGSVRTHLGGMPEAMTNSLMPR